MVLLAVATLTADYPLLTTYYYSLLTTHHPGGRARPASHSLLRSLLDGIARLRVV